MVTRNGTNLVRSGTNPGLVQSPRAAVAATPAAD